MKKNVLRLALFLLLLLPSLITTSDEVESAPQNGLFSAAIEDPSGLCANVSAYNNFVVIDFQPPDQQAGFLSYDAEMVIDSDTIYVSEEDENYSATYRIRYKYPFTADADVVFNGRSYSLHDLDTRNSGCNGMFTQFNSTIQPTGTPPPEPAPQPLTVTARASATSGFAPLTVSFTAAPSKPASIIWKDNGVTFASGPNAQLTFANASVHVITAVASANGETASASLTVMVQQKPPSGGGNGGNNGGN
ncbi:MAG: hypothetical protein AB1631_23485 [Acidobacteriota bacterium]